MEPSRRQCPGRIASTSGLSMLEALVAVLLLAVGALAAAKMQQGGSIANQGGFSHEVAASLARQLLESVDSLSYTDACLTQTGGSYADPCTTLSAANNLDAQGAHVSSGGYQRQWSITDNAAASAANQVYKTIRVRVSWADRGRTSQLTVAAIRGW